MLDLGSLWTTEIAEPDFFIGIILLKCCKVTFTILKYLRSCSRAHPKFCMFFAQLVVACGCCCLLF